MNKVWNSKSSGRSKREETREKREGRRETGRKEVKGKIVEKKKGRIKREKQ